MEKNNSLSYGGLSEEEFLAFCKRAYLDPFEVQNRILKQDALCKKCIEEHSDDELLCIGVRPFIDEDSSKFYKRLIIFHSPCVKRRQQTRRIIAQNNLEKYEKEYGSLPPSIRERVIRGATRARVSMTHDEFAVSFFEGTEGNYEETKIVAEDVILTINLGRERIEEIFAWALWSGRTAFLLDTGRNVIKAAGRIKKIIDEGGGLDDAVLYDLIIVSLQFSAIEKDIEIAAALKFIFSNFRFFCRKLLVDIGGDKVLRRPEMIKEVLGDDIYSCLGKVKVIKEGIRGDRK
jgi:hypothetical protein